MSTFVQLKNLVVPAPQTLSGFSLQPSPQSPRLLQLSFPAATVQAFLAMVEEWPVQALEYKSFLRFRVARILDDLCANTLQPVLINTLMDRATGGRRYSH